MSGARWHDVRFLAGFSISMFRNRSYFCSLSETWFRFPFTRACSRYIPYCFGTAVSGVSPVYFGTAADQSCHVNLALPTCPGSIPRWLSDVVALKVIDLGSNQFVGEIPATISIDRDSRPSETFQLSRRGCVVVLKAIYA